MVYPSGYAPRCNSPRRPRALSGGEQFAGQGFPFLFERRLRRRAPRLRVPIAGVALVPFLAVQVGVDRRPGLSFIAHGASMRAPPITLRIPPQRLEREAEARRR